MHASCRFYNRSTGRVWHSAAVKAAGGGGQVDGPPLRLAAAQKVQVRLRVLLLRVPHCTHSVLITDNSGQIMEEGVPPKHGRWTPV